MTTYNSLLKESVFLTEKELNKVLRMRNKEVVKEKILAAFIRLVYKEANHFVGNNWQNITKDDLIQQGMLGLMKAVDNYRPGKGSFQSFAKKYISGYIINLTNHRIKTENLISCSIDDVCKSNDSSGNSSKESHMSDMLVNAASYDSQKQISNNSDLEYVKKIINIELTKRNRKIFLDYYLNSKSLKEIANEYNYTIPAINIIINNALDKIREYFIYERELAENKV